MSKPKPSLKLGLFLVPSGHHAAAWREPDAASETYYSLAHHTALTQAAERGKMDFVFLADVLSFVHQDLMMASSSGASAMLDPLVVLSALASLTTDIGLISTASTTYYEPYLLAREFATLDYLSGGRAGWNVVTSTSNQEALNFGRNALPPHNQRYERAREFFDAVTGLWDSFDEGAPLNDKASALRFDPTKGHVLDHKGKYFSVRGPLTVPRSAQSRPIIVQAGSSDEGQDFAAEIAEIVFTAQGEVTAARSFYASIKGRMAKFGRHPDDLKIMPGLIPVVGPTEAAAKEKYERLCSLVPTRLGLWQLSFLLGGIDLSGYPLDGPLPDIPATQGPTTLQKRMIETARSENLTIRELSMRACGPRGHGMVIGSPRQIADRIEEWITMQAADGFNLMPFTPDGVYDFVDIVVPELQRRGLFRTAYEGATLRENLGLPRPHSRYEKRAR